MGVVTVLVLLLLLETRCPGFRAAAGEWEEGREWARRLVLGLLLPPLLPELLLDPLLAADGGGGEREGERFWLLEVGERLCLLLPLGDPLLMPLQPATGGDVRLLLLLLLQRTTASRCCWLLS